MKIRTIDRTWLSRFPGAEDWRKVLPVRGGLSTDEKFEIFTRTGEHLILRVADENQTRRTARSIPGAKLLILPGETHGSYVVHSDKLYPAMANFLRG